MVDLACVVAHHPSVVLLDEPSSGIAQREAEALVDVPTGRRWTYRELDDLSHTYPREINAEILAANRDLAYQDDAASANDAANFTQHSPPLGYFRLGGDAIEGPWDGEEAITLLADLDAGATGADDGDIHFLARREQLILRILVEDVVNDLDRIDLPAAYSLYAVPRFPAVYRDAARPDQPLPF